MAKGEDSHSEMAQVRQNDGINVIFDQNSPAPSRSSSRSRSSGGNRRSSGSGRYRGRGGHRRRHRSSSSSSSSSRSSSHTRSRSHPRCHRPSSRCRCDNHRRGRRSPPRRHRSRSRSSSRWSRSRRAVSRFSQSPPRTHRGGSRSGSLRDPQNSSLDDKRELLKAATANARTILGVEKMELPESVKPDQSVESKYVSPQTWVRQDPEKTLSQSDEVESDDDDDDDMFSPKMSPKRKIISFSINNSLVKPTLAAPSSAKVTSRVDSYESRKPYGHWVPVKSGRSSNVRKHSLATSH